MYALQRVNPADWEQIPELVAFYDDLAKKPYCSNEKGFVIHAPKPTPYDTATYSPIFPTL